MERWCPAGNRKSSGSVKYPQRWVSEGEVSDRLRNAAATRQRKVAKAEPYGDDLDSRALISRVDTDEVGLHNRRFRQAAKRRG